MAGIGFEYHKQVLDLAPSLYLPLDNIYGFSDISGNRRDGTGAGGIAAGGGPKVPQLAFPSTDFDGSNDRVTTTYACFVDGTVRTFSGWGYRDNSSTFHILMGGTDNGGTEPSIFLSPGSGATNWVTRSSGGAGNSGFWADAWPTAEWVHWALIFDEPADTVELFIDGGSKGSQGGLTVTYSAPGNFQVGNRATLELPWDGKQAHVAVFERALPAADIRALWKAGVPGWGR